MKNAMLSVGVLLAAATAASGGGYIAPEVDPVIVEPVAAVVPVGNWQGAYGGVGLGYAFGGDDQVGFDGSPSFGDLKLKGANGEVRLGYRWQRDKWVVGPEVSLMGGDIKDSIAIVGGPGPAGVTEVESSVNSVLALKLKTGYEVQPNTLVYGTAGIARGDFTMSYLGVDSDYKANGYVFGMGVERMVSDRMSVTAGIERNHFKKEVVAVGGLVPAVTTAATPTFNNVKLGVNFKF